MKHARKAVMLLAVMLAFCCLSAPAWARVFFPKSIKEIGDEAFMGVPLQTNFLVKSGTEKIGSRAFANTGVELVWLPATLKYVAPDAFDKGTGFVCSPNTYAESWCLENGMDYDYIKPYLTATYTKVNYGEVTSLVADPVFGDEPTSYVWEKRGRERYWSVIEGETDRVLRYTNDQEEGYIYFRVSAVWGDMCSVPSDCVSVRCYGNELNFNKKECMALDGNSVYLEWNYMGTDAEYALYEWSVDPQEPEGGDWIPIDSFKGKWNYTVYGLDKNTDYSFMLGIIDEKGEAKILSESITITTGDTETVFTMHEHSLDGQRVIMSWDPIQNAVYDVYYGQTRDTMRVWASNMKRTGYEMYGFPLNATRYVQVRARIPNTNYVYWGPVLEITPTEAGPSVEFESWKVNGDVVNLQWTPLTGCVYDVYLSLNGVEETCIADGIGKNYLDVGGLRPGDKGTFRVRARYGTWNSTSAEKEIEMPAVDDVAYRALLIGEVNFKGSMYAARNYGDVELVTEMLENVKTPGGTHYSVIREQDLSRSGILSAIQEAFGGADENDVSLLFIATHGDVGHVGRYAGSLSTVEVPNKVHGTLLVADLAAELEKIKGTKIVWLGSCGSGAGIYDEDEEENVADPYYGEYDEDEWDGWPEYEINDDGELWLSDSETFDVGELRLPAFQVLAAARYRYVSWSRAGDARNAFTEFLTDGVCGPDGSMPADMNQDGELTQHELFLYIKLREEDPEQGADQDVQAYPFDSDYVLFKK